MVYRQSGDLNNKMWTILEKYLLITFEELCELLKGHSVQKLNSVLWSCMS